MALTQRQYHLMGTIITLQIDHPEADNLLEQAGYLLEDYNYRFSANRPDSQLMKIAHHAGHEEVKVDDDLFELIELGKTYSIVSKLALNIAIGPLIKLWKIGFKDARVPSPEEIQAKLPLINPNDILLDSEAKTVYLPKAGMEIDLGAVAKGFFADKLKTYLQEHGVQSGIIDLGGNVLTIGQSVTRPDGWWRVGIQDPDQSRGGLVGVLATQDQSVVTSGIYERSLTIDGQTYHHIFDSNTGYPMQSEMSSITIVSDKSIDGELWTTILFAKPLKEALVIADKTPGIEAIVIDHQDQVYHTPNLTAYFQLIR
ncbi:FAD:protein FMN transferase [Hutsoniella sourekii]|uniref:FAD:protein FMN transferase n=1 Tax=Hutsoniella sourekii TaxID=87650 RepID=UPI0004AC637E|nr:FAD:protein FMN transferase [Hutsoniella sourekii]